jgi:uncharacterized protein YjiS (DUF1127 family)
MEIIMSFMADILSLDAPSTPCPSHKAGFRRAFLPLAKLLRLIAEWRRCRADVATLRLMSDRDLRDIGLCRYDVEAIAGNSYRFES